MNKLPLLGLLAALASPLTAQEHTTLFDRSSFGKVVLKRTQALMGDASFEINVGDYNNEPITNYSAGSVFADMGRAVGRLDILTDGGVFPCTAFIVSDKHLLTNHHCVPGILDNPQARSTQIQAVQFVTGYVREGVVEETRTYQVNPVPVETSKDLDYAVLEVFGDPSADWGRLSLAAQAPRPLDPFWVIGHPMGEAKRISREKCAAADPAISDGTLRHTCDTLPGNSGSPVIDASLRTVVALHHAGSNRNAVNYAIPMHRILENSPVLAALVVPEPEEEQVEKVSPEDLQALEARIASLTAELASVRDNATITKAESEAQIAALNGALAQTKSDLTTALDNTQDDSGLQAETKRLQALVEELQSQVEEIERLREKNRELQGLLDEIRNTPGAELYEQRMRLLQRDSSRRIWQIYVASFGTTGLSDPSLLRAASRIEAIQSYGMEFGEAFEEMLELDEAQRKHIQAELAKAGFDPGPVDGAFGTKTRTAIQAWHKANAKAYHKYVNAAMMEAFGLRWTLTVPLEFTSGKTAIIQGAKNLTLLGEDQDLVEKIDCVNRHDHNLSFPATIYARWNGHTYIAARTNMTPAKARQLASDCGGYLVAIGSREENDFVARMVSSDKRLFDVGYDKSTNTNYKSGPLIGMFQDPAGAEPRGGWAWVNGERTTFTAWEPGQPNEHKKSGEDYGHLVRYISGAKRPMEFEIADRWADTDARWSKGFIVEWDE